MGQGRYTWTFTGGAPPPVTIQDSNLKARIGGFTMVNQSNCIAGLYIGRSGGGIPDIQVLQSAMVGIPIDNCPFIVVAWVVPAGDVSIGTAYAHYTDQNIIASANQISSTASGAGVFDSAIWDASIFGP
jgi:hypothetical protein